MKNFLSCATLFCLLLSMSSCSKKLSYFTTNMHNEFDWSESELKKIQFYISQDVVLRRKLHAEDSRITDGKIRVVDGSEVEEVVIKRGTPGILLKSPKTNRFAISFESGGRDKFLMFGPNKNSNGRYVLLAKEWNRNRGTISYNGKQYTTTSQSAYAALLVDAKKAKNVKYKSRSASGRTIGN